MTDDNDPKKGPPEKHSSGSGPDARKSVSFPVHDRIIEVNNDRGVREEKSDRGAPPEPNEKPEQ